MSTVNKWSITNEEWFIGAVEATLGYSDEVDVDGVRELLCQITMDAPRVYEEFIEKYGDARRQPVEPRPCEQCHKDFTPQRGDAHYCSDACRAYARRGRVTITEWIHNPTGWWNQDDNDDD